MQFNHCLPDVHAQRAWSHRHHHVATLHQHVICFPGGSMFWWAKGQALHELHRGVQVCVWSVVAPYVQCNIIIVGLLELGWHVFGLYLIVMCTWLVLGLYLALLDWLACAWLVCDLYLAWIWLVLGLHVLDLYVICTWLVLGLHTRHAHMSPILIDSAPFFPELPWSCTHV
jgi:hypothetical protein